MNGADCSGVVAHAAGDPLPEPVGEGSSMRAGEDDAADMAVSWRAGDEGVAQAAVLEGPLSAKDFLAEPAENLVGEDIRAHQIFQRLVDPEAQGDRATVQLRI